MENIKNPRLGGHREGSGRKPKADEIKLIEQMDAVLVPEKVWQALALKVIEGDSQAQKTWLSYRFGMPKQTIEQKNTFEDGLGLPISINFTKPTSQQK
jgi:hypothetical protein